MKISAEQIAERGAMPRPSRGARFDIRQGDGAWRRRCRADEWGTFDVVHIALFFSEHLAIRLPQCGVMAARGEAGRAA